MNALSEADIKKFRGRARAALTRLHNGFDAQLSLTELKARLEKVEQTYKDFDQYDAALPEQDSEINEFENKYFETKVIYQSAIEALNRTVPIVNSTPVGANFKLPRLNIPSFNGKYTDWLNFKDLYVATVHNNNSLAKIQKFQYLIGLLKDEPANIIKHIPISETTYDEAWDKLLSRYDRKSQIVTSLVRTFLEQPSVINSDSVNLRKLADTSDEVIRGLKSLGEKASSKDVWLIHLLLEKVDSETRHLWSQKVGEEEFPTFECFLEFLNSRCVSLEMLNSHNTEKRVIHKNHCAVKNVSHPNKHLVLKCQYCNGSHSLSKCYKFKTADVSTRKNIVRKNSLCFNCMAFHHVKFCPSQTLCQICKGKHHTLLHEEIRNNNVMVSNKSLSNEQIHNADESENISSLSVQGHNISFLPTAAVKVYDSSGQGHKCCVLFDSGSEASFISETFVRQLNIPRKNARICVKGLGDSKAATTRGYVNIKLFSNSELETNCVLTQVYILDKLTSHLPSENIDSKDFDYLKSINLADPQFCSPKQIDVIIGADYFFSLLRPGQIVGCKSVIAQNTIFGWVISGRIKTESNIPHPISVNHISLHSEDNIDTTLKRFWELEEITVKNQNLTIEEEFCEKHFKENYRVNENGKFVVRLPIFNQTEELGDSKPLAISRLLSMERKFNLNKELDRQYRDFMQEYENLNHMVPVDSEKSEQVYYLPHHAVVKSSSSTTKLRVVFDGSCKPKNSVSLNSILGVGATLQRNIFSVLLNFRLHKIAFSTDIEKMYRQILVDEEDQNLQRIVWRDTVNSKMQSYKLCTVTYGTASAPFLATRCLSQIALDAEKIHPHVSSIIKNDFYVDDCLSGASSVEEAADICSKLSQLLEERGFHLRKWRSNCSKLLEDMSIDYKEASDLEIYSDDCAKTLGLLWNSTEDIFLFNISINFGTVITKRIFISQSSKIFDPLGLLSPCTVKLKMFYQRLWLLKVDWDFPLPKEWTDKLLSFQEELKTLSALKIPRWLQTTTKSICLQGFCDASESAYAAVIYCVQPISSERNEVNLVVAKTKVAPIKQVSLPRLELLGALLLARLFKAVKDVFSGYNISFHAWTDSKVVLSWLADHPRRWKLFVANRTSEILDAIPYQQWSYIPSKENPADIPSRGIDPKLLQDSSLWWHGPPFLMLNSSNWSLQTSISNDATVLAEQRTKSIFCITAQLTNDTVNNLFQNSSSLSKIVNVISFCLRFISRCKKRMSGSGEKMLQNSSSIPPTTNERQAAMKLIIKWIQFVYFQDDLKLIRNNLSLNPKSALCSLSPFFDNDGILRVGGRLQNSDLAFNVKHPIIIPGEHKFALLLVKQYHITYLHAGASLLTNILKQNYWIVKGKKLIHSFVHKCIVCHRYKLSSNNQLMGNLPKQRVTLERPFLSTGIDYAGPIILKCYKGRCMKTTKGYIALFVCLATKAYHIEAVSDLTADSFLAALRRFVSRRGTPQYFFSDNGSNFIGAKRKLSELHNILMSLNSNEMVVNYLAQTAIEWKMIPPSSPHFGGLWESGIKSIKFHLKRMIGETKLTFEELTTLLTQIEAVLNSRPLSKINHADVSNLDTLTPSHFLTGDVITSIPDNSLTNNAKPTLLKRWELLQQMKQGFWKRYYKEYLNSLQQRYKWKKRYPNLSVGDLVLVKEDNIPPGVWPLGRISEIHPGKDGNVRVATVKTAKGYLKRPIVKISPLPLCQE